MATEAVADGAVPAPIEATALARPYPRSWLNVLFDAIDRAPVPAWSIYLAATAVSIVGSNAQGWLAGTVPAGEIAPIATLWGVMSVAGFWILHYLDGVAGESFDAFRPLLDDPPDVVDRLHYELTVIPAVPVLLLTLVAFPMTAGYYLLDPEASGIVGLPPVAMALRIVAEALFTAVFLALVYHTYRQLRRVSRLHARVREIDLFSPGPIYAFSRLTAQTGAVIVLLMVIGYVGNPQALDAGVSVALWLPWLVIFPVFGVFTFVAPLWGMRRRLAAAKDHLRDESEQRLKRLMAVIDRDVDAGDLSRADGLNKSLSSLLQQRGVIAKLSTWPWSATTARGFGTAIMLPLVLFMIQRLLSQYV